MELVRTESSDDQNIDALRARVAELDLLLAARSADVTRMETELAAFKIRYRHEVGLLHEELDELELKSWESSWVRLPGASRARVATQKAALARQSPIPALATPRMRSGSSFVTSRRSSIPISRATKTPATAGIR